MKIIRAMMSISLDLREKPCRMRSGLNIERVGRDERGQACSNLGTGDSSTWAASAGNMRV